MEKAIVIGAGIAGLASAIRLANKGYEVDVFEANSYPGGKLTEVKLGAYRFDAGPSLFTMPTLVDELFELSGRKAEDHFEYSRLDEICRYFYEDGTSFIAHADTEKLAAVLDEQIGLKADLFKKHLAKSAYIHKYTADLFLGKSLHKLKSYLSLDTLNSVIRLPFLNIFQSMDKVNRKVLKNEKARQLFNRYATYNGSNPYKAPGILNIIPHLEFNLGAYFPKGGMHSICLSLFQLAKDLGVNFHFSSPVEKILVKDRKASGIRVGEKEFSADLLVCNMDVVPAYRYLMPEQKQPEKILKQERSSSALIFYWGIKKSFPQLDLHNIFFSDHYEDEFRAIFKEKGIHEDPTVYINISSKHNKSDAPEGSENWFVMINVPCDDGQDWDALIKEARAHIITKLSRMLNTDIAALIEEEEILEPRSIASKTQSYKGALYGTSSNTRMAAFFRHPNFSNRIQNLYFCGGSVHPGGGIPLALSSAKIVDDIISDN